MSILMKKYKENKITVHLAEEEIVSPFFLLLLIYSQKNCTSNPVSKILGAAQNSTTAFKYYLLNFLIAFIISLFLIATEQVLINFSKSSSFKFNSSLI